MTALHDAAGHDAGAEPATGADASSPAVQASPAQSGSDPADAPGRDVNPLPYVARCRCAGCVRSRSRVPYWCYQTCSVLPEQSYDGFLAMFPELAADPATAHAVLRSSSRGQHGKADSARGSAATQPSDDVVHASPPQGAARPPPLPRTGMASTSRAPVAAGAGVGAGAGAGATAGGTDPSTQWATALPGGPRLAGTAMRPTGGAPLSSTSLLPQFSSYATMYDAAEDITDVDAEFEAMADPPTTSDGGELAATLAYDDEEIVASAGTTAGRMAASGAAAPSSRCEVLPCPATCCCWPPAFTYCVCLCVCVSVSVCLCVCVCARSDEQLR